jgi:hypothetical protein
LCAVLSGQIRDGDDELSSLLSLGKLMCQVSWVRHSSRMISFPRNLSSSASKKSQPSELENKNTVLIVHIVL